MKKNDIVEIEITALSSECSGIGKKDGMVIFVPFSAIGDKLEVKILKVNKTYCYKDREDHHTLSRQGHSRLPRLHKVRRMFSAAY